MKHPRDLILVLVGALVGVLVFRFCVPEIGDDRPLSMEPQECVEMCIKRIQEDRVFPDFPAIVKECDWRFGNGCRLEGTGRPPEAARGR